jgi:hypothetical protein
MKGGIKGRIKGLKRTPRLVPTDQFTIPSVLQHTRFLWFHGYSPRIIPPVGACQPRNRRQRCGGEGATGGGEGSRAGAKKRPD